MSRSHANHAVFLTITHQCFVQDANIAQSVSRGWVVQCRCLSTALGGLACVMKILEPVRGYLIAKVLLFCSCHCKTYPSKWVTRWDAKTTLRNMYQYGGIKIKSEYKSRWLLHPKGCETSPILSGMGIFGWSNPWILNAKQGGNGHHLYSLWCDPGIKPMTSYYATFQFFFYLYMWWWWFWQY